MTPISILFKVSILFFAAGLVQALWGRQLSAAARHLVWTLATAGFLLIPVFSFVLPPWTVVTTASENIVHSPRIDAGHPGSLFGSAEMPKPLRSSVEQPAFSAIPASFPWSRAFEGVYAAVAFLLLFRLIVECVSAGRL